MIRGVLFFVAFSIPYYLLINFLEYKFFFSNNVRLILLLLLVGGLLAALGFWVISPLTKYFKLGKQISHEQAAGIIGDHFGNVQDKLLNILQLKEQADASSVDSSLLLAGVDQKAEEIKLVSFPKAIDLKGNKKYLKYALPPFVLILLMLFIDPALLADSTTRLVNPNKEYERPLPFKFFLENEELEVVQFDDYQFNIKTVGDFIPAEAFIEVDNYAYKMENMGAGIFSYKLKNVQKEKSIRFVSGEVSSKDFTLEVQLKPSISSFTVNLDYPAYTGRNDEALKAVGDLYIPTGTKVKWSVDTKNSDAVLFDVKDSGPAYIDQVGESFFVYEDRFLKSSPYRIFLENKALGVADSLSYFVSVLQDQYPEIGIEVFVDSANVKDKFFIGEGSDDYGIDKVEFVYQIIDDKGLERLDERNSIIGKSGRTSAFDYNWSISELELLPGEQVVYYFEIWDNDAVNGSKSARSANMVYRKPSLEEFEKQEDESEELIKDKLEEAIKDSKKVQKKAKELKEKLLQKKSADWQDKKELEKLMEQQKAIEEKVNDAKEAFEKNLEQQEEFTEPSEEIQDKQEKMEELFEELLDEDMEKLMEDIQELMEKLEKDEALEKLEEFEDSDSKMEMEMERMLELFKQLEMEYEMEKAVEKMEELAEKEEQLSKESAEGEKTNEELSKEQEELKEAFEKLEKDLDKIEEMNEGLEKPMDMENLEKGNESIKEDMEKSQDQLGQQENKKASKSQKKAADKMKEKAQSMSMQMQSQQMEQMSEDMEALRQLLENIVGLSFQQEDLMNYLSEATINTPRYVDLVQDQFKLENDFQIVEDSLMALSKRLFQIESFVVDKLSIINENIGGSIKDLEEREVQKASLNQQVVMKNLNDLAVMLSEVMNQMQQDMSSMMPGAQMCNNPGGEGAKPSDKISEGQRGKKSLPKACKSVEK